MATKIITTASGTCHHGCARRSQSPYAAYNQSWNAEPEKRGPLLGILGLALVALMTILICVSGFQLGDGVGQLSQVIGTEAASEMDPSNPYVQQFQAQMTPTVITFGARVIQKVWKSAARSSIAPSDVTL